MRHLHRCVILLVVCLGDSGVASAEGTLFYDAPTGEIFFEIDVPSGRFDLFDIRSENRLLRTENYQRIGDPTILFFLNEGYIADNAGLGTYRSDGLYGLGAIYPNDVPQADFLADIHSTYAHEDANRSCLRISDGPRPDNNRFIRATNACHL